MVKERDRYWDAIKGILMIAVICIHSVSGWDFKEWNYFVPKTSFSFNIWMVERGILDATTAVFFFIAGYLTTEKSTENTGKYYRKRLHRLLIPYGIWTCIYTIINVTIYHVKFTWFGLIFGTNAVQLYFLVVMFQLVFLTPLLMKGVVNHPKVTLVLGFVVVGLNSLYQCIRWAQTHQTVSNEIILCTCWIAYYILGMYKRRSADLKTPKVGVAFAGWLIILILKMIQNYWILAVTDNPIISVSFNTPFNILYSVAVMNLIMSLKDKSELFLGKHSSPLIIEKIGVYSMDFFLIHWVFEWAMKYFIPMKESCNNGFFVGWFMIVTIGTLAISALCIWCYRRIVN